MQRSLGRCVWEIDVSEVIKGLECLKSRLYKQEGTMERLWVGEAHAWGSWAEGRGRNRAHNRRSLLTYKLEPEPDLAWKLEKSKEEGRCERGPFIHSVNNYRALAVCHRFPNIHHLYTIIMIFATSASPGVIFLLNIFLQVDSFSI